MTDLERELRTMLAERAETVAASPDPLAEHQRRLRARGRTSRFAAAAVAVVAVAAIGVAATAVANRHTDATPAGPGVPTAKPAPTVVNPWTHHLGQAPDRVAFVLGGFSARGKKWNAFVEVGSTCVDIVGVPVGKSLNDIGDYYPTAAGCDGPLTPHPPNPLIVQSAVLPASAQGDGPLPGTTVWAVTPNVASMVATFPGYDVTSRELGTAHGVRILVSRQSIKFATSYRYYDAKGRLIYVDQF